MKKTKTKQTKSKKAKPNAQKPERFLAHGNAKRFPQITKDMTLGEVVSKYPKAAEVMLKHGLHCVGCHVASYETVEEGASAHGFDKKQLKKLLDDMNKAVK